MTKDSGMKKMLEQVVDKVAPCTGCGNPGKNKIMYAADAEFLSSLGLPPGRKVIYLLCNKCAKRMLTKDQAFIKFIDNRIEDYMRTSSPKEARYHITSSGDLIDREAV